MGIGDCSEVERRGFLHDHVSHHGTRESAFQQAPDAAGLLTPSSKGQQDPDCLLAPG